MTRTVQLNDVRGIRIIINVLVPTVQFLKLMSPHC